MLTRNTIVVHIAHVDMYAHTIIRTDMHTSTQTHIFIYAHIHNRTHMN